MLDAPIARGYFLGDYMGLERAGRIVHPVFGIANGSDLTAGRPLGASNSRPRRQWPRPRAVTSSATAGRRASSAGGGQN